VCKSAGRDTRNRKLWRMIRRDETSLHTLLRSLRLHVPVYQKSHPTSRSSSILTVVLLPSSQFSVIFAPVLREAMPGMDADRVTRPPWLDGDDASDTEHPEGGAARHGVEARCDDGPRTVPALRLQYGLLARGVSSSVREHTVLVSVRTVAAVSSSSPFPNRVWFP
jgi:hypothetical protein